MRGGRAHTLRAGVLLASVLACANGPAPAPRGPPGPPLGAESVRVHLLFGAAVDLDLYVTGPSQETVYFGNDRSLEGGELQADQRCDAPAPRAETVLFPVAPPGVYRVGVDFMVRCDTGTRRAGYTLWIEAPGRAPQRLEGEAEFGVFEPRVSEFRVGGGP